MKIHLHRESWPLCRPFRIAGKTWTQCEIIVVALSEDGAVGRGECKGVFYLGDTLDGIQAQIESVIPRLERGIARMDLADLLPAGGARNGIDCALWDLAAKRAGETIWTMLDLLPRSIRTPYTIGIMDKADDMADAAATADNDLLKIKLDGNAPLERLRAIRRARPDAELIVDANQGWTFALLKEIAPALAELDVKMIEQPLPRGEDDELEAYACPVPLCADESCQHIGDLETAARRYRMINIKLDKIGGLTDALHMVEACRAKGLDTMIGCMVGTSLAMAPAFVVAQSCVLADIDGPVNLAYDRPFGLTYVKGRVSVPQSALWG